MKLRDWLASTGTTGKALSLLCGVSPSTISRLAAGLHQPDFPTAEAIARATDGAVTPNDFMAEPRLTEAVRCAG